MEVYILNVSPNLIGKLILIPEVCYFSLSKIFIVYFVIYELNIEVN